MILILIIFFLIEEKLLHEEIELKWEDVMNYVKDFQALQKYRSDMFVGVVSNIKIFVFRFVSFNIILMF